MQNAGSGNSGAKLLPGIPGVKLGFIIQDSNRYTPGAVQVEFRDGSASLEKKLQFREGQASWMSCLYKQNTVYFLCPI